MGCSTRKYIQDKLVSGQNIKTVNGNTLLGVGDLVVKETTASIQAKRPIKTVNGNSLEGVGNVVISGGGGGTSNSYFPSGW